MKGILHKTEQGWVVNYNYSVNNNDWYAILLHPTDVKICNDYGDYSVDWDGKEVDFDMVTEWETGEVGVNGLTYAKLMRHPVDTNKMIDHIGEVNEMVCVFEPRIDTSSATICKWCGQEKFLHNHVPDVGNNVDDEIKALKIKLEKVDFYRMGYNRAKETLYTEEQVRKAMNCTVLSAKAKERVIQSLKQGGKQ
jgi:hypothetical protein